MLTNCWFQFESIGDVSLYLCFQVKVNSNSLSLYHNYNYKFFDYQCIDQKTGAQSQFIYIYIEYVKIGNEMINAICNVNVNALFFVYIYSGYHQDLLNFVI